MSRIIDLALTVMVMSFSVGLLEKLLPSGGIKDAAKICLGFVYLATIAGNIAVLIMEWGV
ncbi:MAG: hypothetical protein Q4C04_05850 [Clostridia bacterium]|nr:hypothetical protein [Clostridia bacterium]